MTKGKYTETMQEIKQTQVPKSEGAGVRRTIRAKHSAQDVYFLLTRASAQDETISFEALGVLTYLLSKPDDWEVMVGDLARRGLSRYKVYRALKELREAGYVKLEREYADGKITRWIYTVYEEKLLLEFQDVELQDVEIRDYTEYRDKQNKEKKPQALRKQHAPDQQKTEEIGGGSFEEELPERPNIFSVYEKNIGLLTPLIADALTDALKDYPEQWVEDALKVAVESEVRTWAYARGVLKRWQRDGRDSAAPKPASAASAPKVFVPEVRTDGGVEDESERTRMFAAARAKLTGGTK